MQHSSRHLAAAIWQVLAASQTACIINERKFGLNSGGNLLLARAWWYSKDKEITVVQSREGLAHPKPPNIYNRNKTKQQKRRAKQALNEKYKAESESKTWKVVVVTCWH